MRVLVTGGAGYIGSVLVPMLLERGHQVRVLDSGFFGTDHLPSQAELVIGDILEMREEWLEGMEAVIHLAALSNDPMADFSPRLNYEINAAGAALVAQYAKRCGVPRFIMGSTCSVYGFTEEQEVDEDWPSRPQYPYAISKLMAERALQCLADDSFRTIVLRKGTVIGWSPRMRYDLVANTMVKTALSEGRIMVRSVRLWRPVLDVWDAALAYVKALEAADHITGVFNVAYDNFTIGQIAEEVQAALRERGIEVSVIYDDQPDVRNYRVSTRRAREVLGIAPTISVRESAGLMVDKVLSGINADFANPRYYNIEWMKLKLAEAGRSVR